jgi:2-dehydro-3-deoxygluconokinase
MEGYKGMIKSAVKAFPNFKVIATTLRTVKTATVNSWGAICYADGVIHEATHRQDLEIMDRVGVVIASLQD